MFARLLCRNQPTQAYGVLRLLVLCGAFVFVLWFMFEFEFML